MAGDGRQRIDKWLFFARVAKSRTLAAKLVQAGQVRINREKTAQAAHPVSVGDVLTIALDRKVLVLRVLAPGARRGPYEEARTLYEDLSPPPPEAAAPGPAEREPGSGRPTKRDRRRLDALRDDD
jgi:ribosome-associated heat shock protein Hsp15